MKQILFSDWLPKRASAFIQRNKKFVLIGQFDRQLLYEKCEKQCDMEAWKRFCSRLNETKEVRVVTKQELN